MKRTLIILTFIIAAFSVLPTAAQEDKKVKDLPEKRVAKKQFVIVLKLIPRLREKKNWTEADVKIVGLHFRRLQQLHKEGKVIFVGKTLDDAHPSQFGIVVFEADSDEEARKTMEADDAIKAKIMTATLFPFQIAFR